MHEGWTSKGSYDGESATYRIEKRDEGFYLFIFKEVETYPFADELQDTLEIAQQSAVEDWGAVGDWKKEKWQKTYC